MTVTANTVTGTGGNGITTTTVDGLNTVNQTSGTVQATGNGINATTSGTGGITVAQTFGASIGTSGQLVGGNGINATTGAGVAGGNISVATASIFSTGTGVLAAVGNNGSAAP